MDELKEKYIQFCCDFYNEHTPEDKIWFGRMFDDCHQEHNKRNSSMYRWQFPLKVLKDQEAQINQHQLEIHALGEANLNQAMMLAKKQEEIDDLKSQLNNMEQCYIEKKQQIDGLHTLILNWRGLKIKGIAPEHRAYEKALGDCADQLEQSMRGAND